MNTEKRVERAIDHPSYTSALRYAAQRAYSHPGNCYSVWFDGAAIYVREAEADKPLNSELVCIAQQWTGNTIQLRFAGGHFEWVYV